jgi:hypothetical protein
METRHFLELEAPAGLYMPCNARARDITDRVHGHYERQSMRRSNSPELS